MTKGHFELTARGIDQTVGIEESDFVFVVGNSLCNCTRFQACFFSKLVSRMVIADRCFDKIVLDTTESLQGFEDFIALINGRPITITDTNVSFLEFCARELENDELLAATCRFRYGDKFTLSDVAGRIYAKSSREGLSQDEIIFLAAHFHELDFELLAKLRAEDVDAVLCCPDLKLKSEDHLFKIIMRLAERDASYGQLIHHVQFQYLSKENCDAFLDQIFPDFFNIRVWESIRSYISKSQAPSSKDLNMDRYIVYSYGKDAGPFDGILAQLTRDCGGNPHQRGVMSITASSSACNECFMVANRGWKDEWLSHNQANSYLQFDFKSMRVSITGYTLKSGTIGYCLLSWVLEVSDDGTEDSWVIIDKQSITNPNRAYDVQRYTCSNPVDKLYRFVRLRQTGKNSKSAHNLILSEIEFFGKLQES